MTPAVIRAAYVRQRALLDPSFNASRPLHPMWDGGRDEYTGKKHQSCWPGLASFAAAAGIDDPETWVRAAFELAQQGRLPNPPTPPNLRSPQVLDLYRRQHAAQAAALDLVADSLTQDAAQEAWLRQNP